MSMSRKQNTVSLGYGVGGGGVRVRRAVSVRPGGGPVAWRSNLS
jgi:hypothetical protein